jgi:hypothetical protein
MSKGPGRWQRMLLDGLHEHPELDPVGYIAKQLGRELTRSEQVAVRRAAATLASSGQAVKDGHTTRPAGSDWTARFEFYAADDGVECPACEGRGLTLRGNRQERQRGWADDRHRCPECNGGGMIPPPEKRKRVQHFVDRQADRGGRQFARQQGVSIPATDFAGALDTATRAGESMPDVWLDHEKYEDRIAAKLDLERDGFDFVAFEEALEVLDDDPSNT